MGAALFITLEKEIPGFDTIVSGKALSRSADRLERIARKLGVKPLMEFHSANAVDAADFLEAHDVEGVEIPPEQWFDPDEGLATVLALRSHLEKQPKALVNTADVIADLDAFERVLTRAKQDGTRWHLSVDF